ncbi:MAG: efflux RND transporter permease subunit [Bdellovibrionales bacterium]|nr:efflux RND transporter permease subunit [Bdellovibrionales bacterium]
MKNFFAFFLENSKLTFVVTLALFVMGLMGFMNLRRETRPPVDFARVMITTVFPGASSEEVEDQITLKIEEEIRVVDGMKDSRSISSPGMSLLSLRIDIDNEDTLEVVDELQRALSKVRQLPSMILESPYLLHIKAKEIPILKVLVEGDNTNRKRDQLAFQLKTALERDRGVASVQFTGYKPREFKITLDPKKLQEYHVGLDEVTKAVSASMKDVSAGILRSSVKAEQVKLHTKLDTISKLEKLVVRSNFSGHKILIQDLGKVTDEEEEIPERIRFNGESVTYLQITKKEKEDSIHLSNRIKKLVKNYPAPEGYKLQVYDNEADRTQNQLSIVVKNAWVGLSLVLIVLLLLLPGWLGILSAISLPISILGAVALCASFGITFNSITMLAFIICIGMLVDNSVVVSENYARLRMDENKTPLQSALTSVMQLYKPVTATVLTTVSAFLPMLVTKGVMGQFIKWIPIVVSVALIMSLLDAFVLLPSRLQWTIRKSQNKTTRIQKYFHQITKRFEKLLSLCIRRRYVCSLVLLAITAFSISVSFWGNEFILFPKDDVRHHYIYYEAKEGASIEQTDLLAKRLVNQITQTTGADQIEGLLTQSGMQNQRFSASGGKGESTGEMFLLLKEDSKYRKKPEVLLKKLRNIDNKDFKTLRFEALGAGPPVGYAVHVIFISPDREELLSLTQDFKDQLSQIPGVIEVEDDQFSTGPEYIIEPNLTKMAQLGISPVSLGKTLQTALEGNRVGELVEKGETFYVKIYYDSHIRSNIEDLKKIKIQTQAGSLIPLEEIISLEYNPQGSSIRKRFDYQNSIEVKAKVDMAQMNSQKANALSEVIIKDLYKKYNNTSHVFQGERQHTKESMDSLFQAMVLAVFGIFIILLLLFRKFMISFLTLSSIVLGFIGVSLAFALHQKPLSFLALIGIVGLAGVTINAAIILVSFIEEMRKENPEKSLHEILVASARFRFKPIAITTFTTVLGLFPAAYSLGGYDPILIPMTLSFTWGLLTGSFLTLIWIPCGYAIIEDIIHFFRKLFLR